MKVFILDVHVDDFEYDEIEACVIIAKTEEEALRIAKEQRDVKWEVDKVLDLKDLKEPTLITNIYRHG